MSTIVRDDGSKRASKPNAPKNWKDAGWTDAKWLKHLASLTDDYGNVIIELGGEEE